MEWLRKNKLQVIGLTAAGVAYLLYSHLPHKLTAPEADQPTARAPEADQPTAPEADQKPKRKRRAGAGPKGGGSTPSEV